MPLPTELHHDQVRVPLAVERDDRLLQLWQRHLFVPYVEKIAILRAEDIPVDEKIYVECGRLDEVFRKITSQQKEGREAA